MRRSIALGCGAYLPERRMTNDDLARITEDFANISPAVEADSQAASK